MVLSTRVLTVRYFSAEPRSNWFRASDRLDLQSCGSSFLTTKLPGEVLEHHVLATYRRRLTCRNWLLGECRVRAYRQVDALNDMMDTGVNAIGQLLLGD